MIGYRLIPSCCSFSVPCLGCDGHTNPCHDFQNQLLQNSSGFTICFRCAMLSSFKLSLSLLQSSNDNLAPNLPVQSSHPKIPATPIFHALVAAADVQSSSLFPVLWLHAIRRKPEQYEIGNAAHPILNHPLLGPVYIILPILKVLELESGGFCWVYQGLSWFKANQKTHPKCIPCANGLTPA